MTLDLVVRAAGGGGGSGAFNGVKSGLREQKMAAAKARVCQCLGGKRKLEMWVLW